jgi:hypothetical protein
MTEEDSTYATDFDTKAHPERLEVLFKEEDLGGDISGDGVTKSASDGHALARLHSRGAD